MERLEATQARLKAAAAERATIIADVGAATSRRDLALAELAELTGKAADRRAVVIADEPAELIELYERLRAQQGGVGAAALRRGQCEGCHLSLNKVELNAIRDAAPDDVVRCEECRRILVRTDESGL